MGIGSTWRSFRNGPEKIAMAGMAIALSAAGTGTVGALITSSRGADEVNELARAREMLIRSIIDDDISELRKQVQSIEAKSSHVNATPTQSIDRTEIAGLSLKITALRDRQDRLEAVLTKQPLKVLEIPLLRRDLDMQAKEITSLADDLQKAQEAQWETMKWLIGGLAAAIAAILIPVVTRLANPKGVPPKTPEED